MSSESDVSSEYEQDANTRLNSIWKSIRETKNLNDLKRYANMQQSRTQHASLTKPKQEEQLQIQLVQSKENTTLLLRKLQICEQKNESLRFEVERIRREKEEQLESIKDQYESKLRLIKRSRGQKENNNEQQVKKAEYLNRENERMALRIKSLEFEKRKIEKEMAQVMENNKLLLKKVNDGPIALDQQVFLNGKGQQLLELAECRQTIERLVDLLKRTVDYRDCSMFIDEIKNLHYLPTILKKLKNNKINRSAKKSCQCMVKIDEKLLWSPAECYKIMLEMKLKYDCLNEDCIEEVLYQMNQIYMVKEEKAVKKVRERLQGQMKKLKKKMEESYDQLLAKKQIKRLKKEINNIRHKTPHKSTSTQLESLKNRGQYEDQLKLKEREIKLLHERIRLLETQSGAYDKTLYFEGALWLIDKVLNEMEINEGTMKEFEVKFREKIEQNISAEDWLRSYKQFFENLSEIQSETVGRLLSLKQTTLKKAVQNGWNKSMQG